MAEFQILPCPDFGVPPSRQYFFLSHSSTEIYSISEERSLKRLLMSISINKSPIEGDTMSPEPSTGTSQGTRGHREIPPMSRVWSQLPAESYVPGACHFHSMASLLLRAGMSRC